MFVVFGVNPAVEIPKLRAALPDASEMALMAGVRMCKEKPTGEYDNLEIAERYAQLLREAGWVNVAVKCQVLTPPRKPGEMPGKRWISMRDLDQIDTREQELLRGWKDGSRFFSAQ